MVFGHRSLLALLLFLSAFLTRASCADTGDVVFIYLMLTDPVFASVIFVIFVCAIVCIIAGSALRECVGCVIDTGFCAFCFPGECLHRNESPLDRRARERRGCIPVESIAWDDAENPDAPIA
jgi:hypothetical protein